jgi:hypothetical protein
MSVKIFINYRREDTAGYARALLSHLKTSFPEQIFMDRTSIGIGEDFVKAIKTALRSCEAVIVLIGRDWRVHRLVDAGDPVRLEISTALKRKIKIVPVLVDGGKMPSAADLPADLKSLARRNALEITDQDWDHLIGRLVEALEAHLGVAAAKESTRRESRQKLDFKLLHQKFQPLPTPTGPGPFHMPLERIVPPSTMQAIRRSGQMVFHLVGNTGGVRRPEAQRAVADQMQRQFRAPRPQDRPAFFYHLGDVVVFAGQRESYYEQFYKPYDHYPGSIVAIPGNHDGDPGPERASSDALSGFMANFCARSPQLLPEAQDSARYAMTQPNPYWTLETPLASIIGLYTNVPEGGMLDDDQRAWLASELKAAAPDIPVILTMHHPPYSISRHSQRFDTSYMAETLDQAAQHSGRTPDAVFASHVMNFQRFTRRTRGRDIPYVIAGAGGYPRLHPMARQLNGDPMQVPFRLPNTDVTLETYCNTRHGFVRVTITTRMLKGEYFTVSARPGESSASTVKEDSFSLDLAQHRIGSGSSRYE